MLNCHRMDHFAHLFSFDSTGKKEECQEKVICLKSSSINTSRIFPCIFFLTFFSFLYPTVFFMLYTHARKKFFQKDAFSCLLSAIHSSPVWKTTSMILRFWMGSPFSYLAIVLSQNPIFLASSLREIFKATRCRCALLPSFPSAACSPDTLVSSSHNTVLSSYSSY